MSPPPLRSGHRCPTCNRKLGGARKSRTAYWREYARANRVKIKLRRIGRTA